MASEVKVQLVEGTIGIAIADGHAIVVDRSPKLGGTDLGFKGGDLFLTSIGTCILTTLVGQARHKGVELTAQRQERRIADPDDRDQYRCHR